jgi:hypothetical protein
MSRQSAESLTCIEGADMSLSVADDRDDVEPVVAPTEVVR